MLKQVDLIEEDIKIRLLTLYTLYIENTGRVPNRCNCMLICDEFNGMEVIYDESEISVCRILKDKDVI